MFAGTEREVYVSFDDGDHWQSLRLNMPATSIRDLIVKDDDLVVATHGRGFWILNNITPLHQIDPRVAEADAFLFRPQDAWRVRWNMNTDTPLPPDEPAGQNPPDGAITDYALKSSASGPLTLEILDSAGKLVRRYSSADSAEGPDPATASIPLYWYRPPHVLLTTPGMHRFIWDLHYQPLPGGGGRGALPMTAVTHNTAPAPNSSWAAPGEYAVRLTVNGQSYAQPLTVKMDPRVKTPGAGLAYQFALAKEMYDGALDAQSALQQLRSIRAQVKQLQERADQGVASEALAAFDKKAVALEGSGGGGGRFGGGFDPSGAGGQDTLAGITGLLSMSVGLLQGADAAPTSQVVAAVTSSRIALGSLMARWSELKGQDLPALNTQLKQANLPPIAVKP